MKTTIDINSKEDQRMTEDGNLLHVPEDWRGLRITNDVLDYIERRVRELNGGDQDKLLCGGCVLGIAANLPLSIMERGDASIEQVANLFHSLSNEYAEKALLAGMEAVLKNPDAKLREGLAKVRAKELEDA